MKLWQDEIFAPVLSLVKVTDLKEGIALANKSEFANGACLFTDSASSIRYFRANISSCHNFISVVTSSKIVGLTK